MRTAVIDRAQPAQPKQLGQPVGINLIALVALACDLTRITDDYSIGERRDQIVQPLRLGPHLERVPWASRDQAAGGAKTACPARWEAVGCVEQPCHDGGR